MRPDLVSTHAMTARTTLFTIPGSAFTVACLSDILRYSGVHQMVLVDLNRNPTSWGLDSDISHGFINILWTLQCTIGPQLIGAI